MKKVNVTEMMQNGGIVTSFEDQKIYISESAMKMLRAHEPNITMNYRLMKLVCPSFKDVIVTDKIMMAKFF